MNWVKTPLTEGLRLHYPLVQAPMGEDITTPRLVASVSNAGALGSLAAGHLEPEAIAVAIAEIRELTDKPFAVNLFIPPPTTEDTQALERARELLAPIRRELGLAEEQPVRQLPNFNEQLAAVLEARVDILSFSFGVPAPEDMETLKEWNITVIGTATHLLEAILLEESGVDLIVAQGAESGGHRATFLGQPEQGLVGTMALIPVLVDHVRVPVIAAGGIMDSRGITAALNLGAAGVQIGTAFLPGPESGAHPKYKELLLEGTEINTTLTRAISGKLARTMKNRLIGELAPHEGELPVFPLLDGLTWDIRRAAREQNRPEFMALWAGQGCALCHAKPANELIQEWMGKIRSTD